MTLLVNNLGFERNDQPIFSNISFQLQKGELLKLQGVNGSGKSTLLRMLAGFIEPQEGQIHWGNQSILQNRDNFQKNILYIGHQSGIKPQLSVRENLLLSISLQYEATSEAIEQAIEQFGLLKQIETQALYLSAGQLRRISLAKLSLTQAKLWLLDEPMTALDSQTQHLLTELISQHLNAGGMSIIATHQALALEGKTIVLGEIHA
jgi:heme exporter protein A